ncbi:hypothetical protein PHYPO_G00108160 [Pangasianodon hypophthalmus]|uniref:AIG1-type G domain-containing protein n=1 Tax=Pangasianodon hypophthalmus TaxID=310915 RepID=A0A5N5PXQ1_PANHP|nr:hypothetical protein PHYPO_G00108160 [Pangasianodon hypophthalmus]
MASGFSPTAPGGPPPISDRRIVLLGKAGAGKNRVVRVILRDTKLNEDSEECFLYEGEQAGRRICIVDTPGWDRVSIECTAMKIKNKITRSVTLCPPGPHALILVLPVNTGDGPSLNELKSAIQHMELLSERVWNHTMVLFLCDEDVEESTITDHIQKAEKLLEKCRGRHYVMRQSEPETQVHGLLKEIDSVVEENLGDFFLPQAEEETVLQQRRGSAQATRPSFNEDENQAVDIDDIKRKYRDDLLALAKYYLKPVGLLVLAVIGALIGSVAGSNYGVLGSSIGIIIGIVVTIPLALWLINAASLAQQSSTLVGERKSEHID